ncbi:hypothetical protein BRC88_08935 [Halobacteriales archaeon QS_4_69_225]|nr:MAG: hypothetical protein BRC88_08935 [Halobacteriales archaeon QS_4_69_225]
MVHLHRFEPVAELPVVLEVGVADTVALGDAALDDRVRALDTETSEPRPEVPAGLRASVRPTGPSR